MDFTLTNRKYCICPHLKIISLAFDISVFDNLELKSSFTPPRPLKKKKRKKPRKNTETASLMGCIMLQVGLW